MFVKSVVAVSLFGLSINCFAGEMVAPGVEKLYESHTVTGENFISGHYVSESSNAFFFNNLLTAQTQQYSGYVGRNILMTGSHSFSIVNRTQSRQTYQLRTWLCTNKNDCSDHQIGYGLDPGSSFSDKAYSQVNANFLSPGLFVLTAATIVSGGENNKVTDSKYITISK